MAGGAIDAHNSPAEAATLAAGAARAMRICERRAAKLAELEARAQHEPGVRFFIGEPEDLRAEREEELRKVRILRQTEREFAERARAA